MVQVEERPLILFPGLTLGTLKKAGVMQPFRPMTSSLGYKRNAKRTETNVIGDGLPLTNLHTETNVTGNGLPLTKFQTAKRLETPTS